MAEFNLLDAPWIPVVWGGDGHEDEVSLADALRRAHEIREVRDPSPLVTAALHRLLLAVVHRTLGNARQPAGPENWQEWRDLWQQRRFDPDQLTRYFYQWRHRFELFGEDHPFYQAASLDFIYERSITNLTHELNTDGTTLFDHTTRENSPAFAPARAARYLVAQQSFAIGGLVSLEKGQDPKLYKSADAAPLTKGVTLLVRGESLFETLMLNLHRYSQADETPFPLKPTDAPAWERDTETRAEDRYPDGYLDLLTWQSRRIRLHPSEEPDGTVVIRSVVVMKGNQFPDGFHRLGRETMLAFRLNKDAKAGQDPAPAVSFQPERALWRDSMTLLQTGENVQYRPKTLTWLHDLCASGALDASQIVPLAAYGLGSDRAKIFFWRVERLPLPLAYLSDAALLAQARAALELAERVGRILRDAAGEYARYVFVPDPPDDPRARADLYRLRGADITALQRTLAPGRRYWPELETTFARFLVAQAGEARDQPMAADAELPPGPAIHAWVAAVHAAARADFAAMVSGADVSARTMKAAVKARGFFEGLTAYWVAKAGLNREEGLEHAQ